MKEIFYDDLSIFFLILLFIDAFSIILWNYTFVHIIIFILLFFSFIYTVFSNFRLIFRNFQPKKPKLTNLLVYVFIGSLSLNITLLLYSLFGFRNVASIDTHRYLISAIIQSEAAIISIIITLTLIGIQLVAQKYSNTVTDIFKKYPDVWIILSIYIFSIIFGVFALKSIPSVSIPQTNETLFIYYQTYGHQIFSIPSDQMIIACDIALFIFCLISIGPYLWNTMTIFRPENIIGYLTYRIISENNIFNQIVDDLNDNIITYFEIIYYSFENHDIRTIRHGINNLEVIIIEISKNSFTKNVSRDFAEDFRIKTIYNLLHNYTDFSNHIKEKYLDHEIKSYILEFKAKIELIDSIKNFDISWRDYTFFYRIIPIYEMESIQ